MLTDFVLLHGRTFEESHQSYSVVDLIQQRDKKGCLFLPKDRRDDWSLK